MVGVPRLGLVVYASTSDDGTVKSVGIRPYFGSQTVLYFSRAQVVQAIENGAELKVAYGAMRGAAIGLARGKYLTVGRAELPGDQLEQWLDPAPSPCRTGRSGRDKYRAGTRFWA